MTGTGAATTLKPDDAQSPPRGWLGFATGHRTAWLLAVLPILLGLFLIGFVGQAERARLATDSLPAGFDSTAAVELAEQLPETDTKAAVIVFSADEGDLSPGQLEAIGEPSGHPDPASTESTPRSSPAHKQDPGGQSRPSSKAATWRPMPLSPVRGATRRDGFRVGRSEPPHNEPIRHR